MRDKVVKFVHEMRHARSAEVAAICVLTAGHLDSRLRKSTAFPAEFLARGKELRCSYELEQ